MKFNCQFLVVFNNYETITENNFNYFDKRNVLSNMERGLHINEWNYFSKLIQLN